MPFSQVWLVSFPGNCIDDSFEHCITTSRSKAHEKSFWTPSFGSSFCHLLKITLFFFLDIVQDCSLGQCLTSNRAETSPNWGRNDLFYSNVEHPLKLACFCFNGLSCHKFLMIISGNISIHYTLTKFGIKAVQREILNPRTELFTPGINDLVKQMATCQLTHPWLHNRRVLSVNCSHIWSVLPGFCWFLLSSVWFQLVWVPVGLGGF